MVLDFCLGMQQKRGREREMLKWTCLVVLVPFYISSCKLSRFSCLQQVFCQTPVVFLLRNVVHFRAQRV